MAAAGMARSCRERRYDPVLSPHDGHVALPFDAEASCRGNEYVRSLDLRRILSFAVRPDSFILADYGSAVLGGMALIALGDWFIVRRRFHGPTQDDVLTINEASKE